MSLDKPFDISSADFKRNAHSHYARLRENTPVCRVRLPTGQPAWLLSRYDDVAASLKDARFAKDAANAPDAGQRSRQPRIPKVLAPLQRNMLDRDDPDHSRLRRLVQTAFTPRRIQALTDSTRLTSDRLLDQLQNRSRFDLVADYALPLPVDVISDLLGVPKRDRARFARWSHAMIQNTLTPVSVMLALPHMLALVRYLRRLMLAKRAEPQDDLVSDLVRVQGDTGVLDDDELLGMMALLLTAGHETTTNLIGNGMLALLTQGEEAERLRAEPELIGTAVEEMLRFLGPVETSTLRFARQDLEIADVAIGKGDVVLGIVASANRDPRQFDQADRMDIARMPNRHLTFGMGGHYCLGAPLARMEGAIAIHSLLGRFPNLRISEPDKIRWRRGLVLRGLDRLVIDTGTGRH
jgi:cytochrome P450